MGVSHPACSVCFTLLLMATTTRASSQGPQWGPLTVLQAIEAISVVAHVPQFQWAIVMLNHR